MISKTTVSLKKLVGEQTLKVDIHLEKKMVQNRPLKKLKNKKRNSVQMYQNSVEY